MPSRRFKVVATIEDTIEVDQDYDSMLCDEHKEPKDETTEQWDERMDAILNCDGCAEKAWEEAYNEAYDKFPRMDDLEVNEI